MEKRGLRLEVAGSENLSLSPVRQESLEGFGRFSHSEKYLEQQQPAFQVHGNQEVFLRVLFSVFTQPGSKFGMGEKIADLVRAAFDRVHQNTGQLVDDLSGNSAHCAGDDWFLFPQSFRNRKTKAFFQRFLDDYGGSSLQGIDLQRRPWRQVEDDDVRIVSGSIHNFLQNHGSFRIVGCSAAG